MEIYKNRKKGRRMDGEGVQGRRRGRGKRSTVKMLGTWTF